MADLRDYQQRAIDQLYAWFAAVYARLAHHGVRPCTIAEIIAASEA